MKVKEMADLFKLQLVAGREGIDTDVAGGLSSDLLSNVMGMAEAGNVWLTMHGHQNIVAVASLSMLSAIILTSDTEPDEDTLKKADAEGIPLYKTSMSTFDLSGKLYEVGVGK